MSGGAHSGSHWDSRWGGTRERRPRSARRQPQASSDLRQLASRAQRMVSNYRGSTDSERANDNDLRTTVELLAEQVRELTQRVRELEGEAVEVREVPSHEATRLVCEYYAKHPGEHYPSAVADALGLDARVVFEITNQLVSEGTLE